MSSVAEHPVQIETDSGFERFLLLFNGRGPDKLVGMFQSFFDESGGSDHGFITVCGWLSTVERWQGFESEWKAMLAHYDVPYFHMKELSQFRGPFAKWMRDRAEREEFFKDAARIIRDTVQIGFMCVVWYEAFRKVNERFHLKKHQRSPYAIAGRFCIARVNQYVLGTGATLRDVAYVFEDGGPDAGGLVDLAKRSNLKLPVFESSRDTEANFATVQLQAADYLAYEVRKAVVDHRDPFTKPEEFRRSFQALFSCEVDQGNYDEEHLLDLCEGAKIPERIV